jgi:hypothetical protein
MWMRPQRVGDRSIMDDVANLPGIKPSELVYVQRVRLYLSVTQRLPTSPPAMGKNCAHGYYQLMRTHANLFFASLNKNNHQRHPTSSQPDTGLYDCVMRPLKLRNWNIQWDHGIKDASTKCGTHSTDPNSGLVYMWINGDAFDCMNADPKAITTNTAMCNSITVLSLSNASQSLDNFTVAYSTPLPMHQ